MIELEEKIRETRKLLRKGIPQGELITDLIDEGYSEEEIEKIFNSSNDNTDTKKSKAGKYPLLNLISVALIILGITLLLGPQLWISEYAWFLIVPGLIGISLNYILHNVK
jgi:hypothetical protein